MKTSDFQNQGQRFMATPSAFPFLNKFPLNCEEAFQGKRGKSGLINIDEVDNIIKKIKDNYCPNHVSHIFNWNKSLKEIIPNTEIWLITDADIYGNTIIPVVNYFTSGIDSLKVPEHIDIGPVDIKSIERKIGNLVNEKEERDNFNLDFSSRSSIYLLLVLFIGILRLMLSYLPFWTKSLINEGYKDFLIEIQEIMYLIFKNRDIFSDPRLQKEILNSADVICSFLRPDRELRKEFVYRHLEELERLIEDYYITNEIEGIKHSEVISILGLSNNMSLSKIIRLLKKIIKVIFPSENTNALKPVDTEANEIWNQNDQNMTDWLACYCPKTGTILIRADKTLESFESRKRNYSFELYFQQLLLHEFIHAALDLSPRPFPNAKWIDGDYNEESLDNTLVLKVYKTTKYYNDVFDIIKWQPYYYRKAISLIGDSSRFYSLLSALIEFKVVKKTCSGSIFYVNSIDCRTKGELVGKNKIRILAGSIIRGNTTPSYRYDIKERENLLATYCIDTKGHFQVVKDFPVMSFSRASSIALGRQSSGNEDWKDIHGNPLKNYI